jgi:phosphoribosylformimino-5-aminoimidazole carboxamide ribotide isomerase
VARIDLYPAVDIHDGKAVRLEQGDFAREKVYDADPLAAAQRWVDAGARRLHVVDLDGAKEGAPRNIDQLERITGAVDVPVQYGGGLRSIEHAEGALERGAARIVLGTAAFVDERLLTDLLAAYGERVAVGVDVRGGGVALQAWSERTDLSLKDAVRHLAGRGVGTIVFTHIDRDGTMSGVDLDAARDLADAAEGAKIVYSGGIGTLDDLRALAALELDALAGVIVGKALFENRFTVTEALDALEGVAT